MKIVWGDIDNGKEWDSIMNIINAMYTLWTKIKFSRQVYSLFKLIDANCL